MHPITISFDQRHALLVEPLIRHLILPCERDVRRRQHAVKVRERAQEQVRPLFFDESAGITDERPVADAECRAQPLACVGAGFGNRDRRVDRAGFRDPRRHIGRMLGVVVAVDHDLVGLSQPTETVAAWCIGSTD